MGEGEREIEGEREKMRERMRKGRERKREREALGNEKWTAPPLPSLMKFSGTESHCLEIPWTFYFRDIVLLLFFPRLLSKVICASLHLFPDLVLLFQSQSEHQTSSEFFGRLHQSQTSPTL